MAKKIIISIVVLLEIGLCLFLVFYNLNSFKISTDRLLDIKDIPNIKNYFQISNENNNVLYKETINDISNIIESFSIL